MLSHSHPGRRRTPSWMAQVSRGGGGLRAVPGAGGLRQSPGRGELREPQDETLGAGAGGNPAGLHVPRSPITPLSLWPRQGPA